jgi:hypothetical protein
MSDDLFDQINDLFDDEEPTPTLGDVPQVKVLLTGRAEQYVALGEGDNTVAQVLDAAGLMVRPGSTTEVYVDGVLAGMDTIVQPGQSIVPLGLVKGG